MADNIFEILIKYGLDSTKAKEAAKELDTLKAKTTDTGKEAVKQEELVKTATDKTVASKKQFRDAIKGLQVEFPIFGRLASFAINPIGAAVLVAASSFRILRDAIQQTQTNLAGFNLPDATESQVDRIDRYATKLGRVKTQSENAKTALDDLRQEIQANAEFWTALGMDLGTGPKQEQAAAASDLAAAMLQSGRINQQAGMDISDTELAKLRTNAAAAEEFLKSGQANQQYLDDYRAGKKSAFGFGMKFGFGTSVDEAQAAQDQGVAQAGSAIGRYNAARIGRETYLLGEGQVKDASAMSRDALGLRYDIRTESAGAAAAAGTNLGAASIASLPQDFMQFFNTMLALQKSIDEATKELKRYQATTNRKP